LARARKWALGAAAASVALAGVGMTASAAGAEEPWGFEQITPSNKGAGALQSFDTFRPSPDGRTFLWSASTPFDSLPNESVPVYIRYLARRGDDAWVNRALDAPFKLRPEIATSPFMMSVVGTSPDLGHAVVVTTRALTAGAIDGGSNLYMRDTESGAYRLIFARPGTALYSNFAGLSGAGSVGYVASDGRSALFSTNFPLEPGHTTGGVYSWSEAGGLRPESVLPASAGGGWVAGGTAGTLETGPRESMPTDAHALDRIYFEAVVASDWAPVYVRENGATKAISVSQIDGASSTPVPARLIAVSEAARYALFVTLNAPPLTDDAPASPTDQNMYRYDSANGSLTYIGEPYYSGAGALQMSSDGQTIVYQSHSAVAGDAVPGMINMYVWRNGTVQYVATTTGDFPMSSAASTSSFLRLLSPSGRFLAYTDNDVATAQRFGYDNRSLACPAPSPGGPGGCDQVYLYDTQTAELRCVSCRPDGQPPSGNSGDPAVSRGAMRMDRHQMRTVTDDGTVFFTSPDDLVSDDANGTADAYAYEAGNLRLLSRATQGTRARFVDATPDGKTVFFATDDPITPTDTDRAVDIYASRAGAGFPYTAPRVDPPCTGSDCRGPLAPAVPAPVAASVSFVGSGNVDEGVVSVGRVSVSRVKAVTGVVATLKVTVPGTGRIVVSGDGLKKAGRTVSKAGSFTVKASLSERAQRAMRRSRSLKKVVRVTFSPVGGEASSASVPVTFKSVASSRKGR
jgi:hypothetical protein